MTASGLLARLRRALLRLARTLSLGSAPADEHGMVLIRSALSSPDALEYMGRAVCERRRVQHRGGQRRDEVIDRAAYNRRPFREAIGHVGLTSGAIGTGRRSFTGVAAENMELKVNGESGLFLYRAHDVYSEETRGRRGRKLNAEISRRRTRLRETIVEYETPFSADHIWNIVKVCGNPGPRGRADLFVSFPQWTLRRYHAVISAGGALSYWRPTSVTCMPRSFRAGTETAPGEKSVSLSACLLEEKANLDDFSRRWTFSAIEVHYHLEVLAVRELDMLIGRLWFEKRSSKPKGRSAKIVDLVYSDQDHFSISENSYFNERAVAGAHMHPAEVIDLAERVSRKRRGDVAAGRGEPVDVVSSRVHAALMARAERVCARLARKPMYQALFEDDGS